MNELRSFLNQLTADGVFGGQFIVVSIPDWNGGRQCELLNMNYDSYELAPFEYIEAEYEDIYDVIKHLDDTFSCCAETQNEGMQEWEVTLYILLASFLADEYNILESYAHR
jgi:hypothetical protein